MSDTETRKCATLRDIDLALRRIQVQQINSMQAGIEELQEHASSGDISELIAGLANQTALHAEALETLKGRQAISGGLQAISLTILVLWIMMLAGKALCALCVKKVEQHEEEKHQEMIEMLESALAKRKAKRRATAKQVGDAPQ